MKKISFILSFVLFAIISSAQDNTKMTVSFEPFTIPQGVDYGNYPQQIFTVVSGGFFASNRFAIMPTDNWNIPQDATGDPYIDVAKGYGVTYLITGSITGVNYFQNASKDANGNIMYTYSARVSIGIKIITVETGIFYTTKTFDVSSALFALSPTPEAAINNAIKRLGIEVKKWVGETFPLTIELVRIMEQNDKKGAVKILIKAGSDIGVLGRNANNNRTRFKIVEYATEMVDGKSMNRTVQVGTAEADQVEDANFTDCKVTNGGRDVAKKIGDGKKLFLITIN